MATVASPVLGKRRTPPRSTAMDAASSAGVLSLDTAEMNMTVEAFLKHTLEKMTQQAQDAVDDAIDEVSLRFKQLREELQEYRHRCKEEQRAKNKAGMTSLTPSLKTSTSCTSLWSAAKKKVWDVECTVIESGEGCDDLLGKVFMIAPRQTEGLSGMCKIGRSSAEEFKGTQGISLPTDFSVSTWHGKITSVWGTIYFTDLNTKNGSRHNGERIAKDTPVALKTGDTISVGDTTLRIQLVPAMIEEES